MASNEVEKAVKRRSWGKARNREKIAVIDKMEVDVLMKESSTSRSADKRATCVGTSDIDLQHPELMASDTLTAILSQRRVPIPVYEDGNPSRERLIYLFKKHVTPQPQRDSYWRRPGRGWRKRKRNEETPMEVDNTGAGDWVLNSDEDSAETPVQRKRKLHEEESSETSSPPKRVSLHVTCQSFSKIKVEDDESTPELTAAQPTPCPDPPRRIIKVKRPAKIDGTTRDTEKVARTAGWTSGGSGKSSSGAVNGKSRPSTEKTAAVQSSQRAKITWP